MLKKIMKKTTHNLGLKILAVFFAIVLWIVVVNIDDPMVPRSFTTSITPINEEYITAQNKYYEPLDSNNTVTFTVSAKRSVLDELSNSDFTAVADMEKIEYDQEDGRYRVPVTITATRYSSSVEVTARQYYYEVGLEDLGTSQKVISASTKGTVADGCALGNVTIVGSNLLKISGPYSVVSQVDTAVATINVEGMATDVTDSVVPVLYDASGNIINTAKLKLSISTVAVAAQILNTKDVSLEFSTTGTAADGYTVTGITYSPDTVRIKGQTAVLNAISKVAIPAEVLDVTGATETIHTTVDITSYLPEGASLVLTSDARVEVEVRVEPVISKTLQVSVDNLSVEGLRNGYNIEYMEDSFSVEVFGPKSVIDGLTAGDIRGIADAGRLGSGEHMLRVTITAAEDAYWTQQAPEVPVVISGTASGSGNTVTPNHTDNGAGGGTGTPDTGNTNPVTPEGRADAAPPGDAGGTEGTPPEENNGTDAGNTDGDTGAAAPDAAQ